MNLKSLVKKIHCGALIAVLPIFSCFGRDCSPITIPAAVQQAQLVLEIELVEYVKSTIWRYRVLNSFKGEIGTETEGIIKLKENRTYLLKDSLIVFGERNPLDGALEPIENCSFQKIVFTGSSNSVDFTDLIKNRIRERRKRRLAYHQWIRYSLESCQIGEDCSRTLGRAQGAQFKMTYTSITNAKVLKEKWQPIFIELSWLKSGLLNISILSEVSENISKEINSYFETSLWEIPYSVREDKYLKQTYVVCIVLISDVLSLSEF